MKAKEVISALRAVASNEQKKTNEWFFRTGPGEYGEGDQFLGVKVPQMRSIAKKCRATPLEEVKVLLESPLHEVRLTGLYILVLQYEKAKAEDERSTIIDAYLAALDAGYINNWDLVDASAHKLLGRWLKDKDRSLLHEFSRSGKLWHERVSMMACYYFIQDGDFDDALQIAERLLTHQHDLIHKVVGWMLREVGKQDQTTAESFLKKHYHHMPRTMLRYAIEKFPEKKRQAYLKGTA